MEEGEKGLLMGASLFGFLMAFLLARGLLLQAGELQETAYDRNLWKRNVVMITLDTLAGETGLEGMGEMEGTEYG